MENLTLEQAKKLTGKTIIWTAPKAEDNNGFYSGKSKILSIKNEKLITETLKGDNLDYAFIYDDVFNYSDEGRFITIKNIL